MLLLQQRFMSVCAAKSYRRIAACDSSSIEAIRIGTAPRSVGDRQQDADTWNAAPVVHVETLIAPNMSGKGSRLQKLLNLIDGECRRAVFFRLEYRLCAAIALVAGVQAAHPCQHARRQRPRSLASPQPTPPSCQPYWRRFPDTCGTKTGMLVSLLGTAWACWPSTLLTTHLQTCRQQQQRVSQLCQT